jgi:membrane protein implicated in regulation of membrane protease activity
MTAFLAIAIYGFATVIFVILGFIIVYHLMKYGFMGDATKFMIFTFAIVSILLIVASSIYVTRTDWSNLTLSNTSSSKVIQSTQPILGY